MPPKQQRKSVHERLAENQKKTHKLRLAAALEECYAALRALPEHAVSVRDHLASLGVDFKATARSDASGQLDAVHDDAEEDMSKSVSNPADIPELLHCIDLATSWAP